MNIKHVEMSFDSITCGRTITSLRVSILAFAVTTLGFLPAIAHAQAYPGKPIRIIVPFQSGGSMESIVRLVGQKLTAAFGQPIVIENRPGAGGMVGTEFVAKSPNDGYTLLATPSAFVMNAAIHKNSSYDPVRDFEAVTLLVSYPLVLVIHPSLPARSVKTLISLAKAQPGILNYSSGGLGTSNHVAAALFANMIGVRLAHVPYKGGGPAFTALISGEVHLMFAASQTAAPFLKSGRLRVLGVSTAKRSRFLSEVPTIAEAGLPGYEATSWNALFAPAGTPVAIVKRISEGVGKGLRQADALEIFEKQGLDEATGTPEELAALVRTEFTKWAKVIKAAGIKPE